MANSQHAFINKGSAQTFFLKGFLFSVTLMLIPMGAGSKISLLPVMYGGNIAFLSFPEWEQV